MSEDKKSNLVAQAKRWKSELGLSKKEDEKWIKRGEKIVKRYRDDRSGTATDKKYNILWANIQTMLPALYGKTPKAQVERRYKDQDPVGRTASTILERTLQYEIDHNGDYDAAIENATLDRLLPGRGTAWVRFETEEIELVGGGEPLEDQSVSEEGAPKSIESTPVDYVFWKDFRCSPARTWDEVTWVARRVYMSRADVIKRFGKEYKDIELTHEPIGLDQMKATGASQSELDSLKKAQVWEIWDKPSKTVCWVADGCDKALDYKDDPYGLDNFWPCPRPLYATQTTDTLVPIPDYALYQDQADELDMVTTRIGKLVEAVKVVGVYDASQTGVQRMLNEGVDNTMIPVDSWAAFGEKGGLKGTIDFLPLDMVIKALSECYAAREQSKQVIYEITGLSDIIRGASVASETATAQQIKSQYASLRLKRLQKSVAQFASELLRIKAQMICDLYSPETLKQMSGIMGTKDGEFADQAIELMKSEPARNFRIEVASDSLVEMDEQAEKASRIEFLTATGTFMEKALPVAMQAPEMAPLIAQMLLFAVRSFKGGRQMEGEFDNVMEKLGQPQQPKGPSAEEQKAQADAQLAQQKVAADAQIEQVKAQKQAETDAMQLQKDLARENHQAELDAQRMAMQAQYDDARHAREIEFQRWKAQLDASTKVNVAEIGAQATLTTEQNQAADAASTD